MVQAVRPHATGFEDCKHCKAVSQQADDCFFNMCTPFFERLKHMVCMYCCGDYLPVVSSSFALTASLLKRLTNFPSEVASHACITCMTNV